VWAVDRRFVTASVFGLLAATFVLSGSVSVVSAAPIFDLADRSSVIVRGVVQGVQTYRSDTLQVFAIEPKEVLKGDAAPGKVLALVQERVFGTERPYFEPGVTTLVFAVPLPMYSSYRQALPETGEYLQWTERKDTATEIASLGDAPLVGPVRRYLAAHDDRQATAALLARFVSASVPRLRRDALATIEARPALAAMIEAQALASLDPFLADERVPVAERAQILVRLARAGVTGLAPIAEKAEATGGPLRAAAVDTLVSLGRLPPEERLLAYSRSEDSALRLVAVRGLARTGSPRALDRIAEVVASDPSDEVCVAALGALGSVQVPRAVPLLAAALRDSDRARVNAAAEALGRIASPTAITALGDALASGSYDAQAAAAFALGQTRKEQAMAILAAQEEMHPDPRVRKVIRIALGKPAGHE
jgi:HEAT repeat protein